MPRTTAATCHAALRVLVVASLFAISSAQAAETPIPAAPDRWVTDHAGLLSAAATTELDARLGDYDRQSGHQLLVYIDRTTGGVPIEDWAVKAFERWKVGRKDMDDGLVLLVFSDDHRLRIEVGYGLEDRVPDVVASRIISERIVPRIRAGDNDGAIRSGVDALIAALGGEGTAGAGDKPLARLSIWHIVLGAIALMLLIGFVITHPRLAWLMLLTIQGGGGRGGWGGGGGFSGGGGGGGFSGGGGRSGGGGASGSW